MYASTWQRRPVPPATTADIAANAHVLTPGRYVGAEDVADDGEDFDEKMRGLTATLHEQFAESARSEKEIQENLRRLEFA